LDVVRAHPERLSVVALAGGRNRDLLLAQCEAFRPRCVSTGLKEDADWLRSRLSYAPELHWGPEGLLACALHPDADTVVAAIVGSAGLGEDALLSVLTGGG
jgi:1-deoxy-D-xylulose-5-phosphate reductoisomerase